MLLRTLLCCLCLVQALPSLLTQSPLRNKCQGSRHHLAAAASEWDRAFALQLPQRSKRLCFLLAEASHRHRVDKNCALRCMLGGLVISAHASCLARCFAELALLHNHAHCVLFCCKSVTSNSLPVLCAGLVFLFFFLSEVSVVVVACCVPSYPVHWCNCCAAQPSCAALHEQSSMLGHCA